MRIAVAALHHETNTFCPERADDLASVTIRGGDEVLDVHPRSFIGGFVEGVGTRADLVPTAAVSFTGGGPASEQVFVACLEAIIEPLRAAEDVDGVYLALHGAMAVREVPRPEAEIARRVRGVVGIR